MGVLTNFFLVLHLFAPTNGWSRFSFKSNSMWVSFHVDLQKLVLILRKNLYSLNILNEVVHRYVSTVVEGDSARPSAVAGRDTRVTWA